MGAGGWGWVLGVGGLGEVLFNLRPVYSVVSSHTFIMLESYINLPAGL